jgi:hypothetical protein
MKSGNLPLAKYGSKLHAKISQPTRIVSSDFFADLNRLDTKIETPMINNPVAPKVKPFCKPPNVME